jgi:hypothetical protein
MGIRGRVELPGVLALCLSTVAYAQSAVDDRVMPSVRVAMAPALPFPDSDADGGMPADGKPASPWMVRPLQAGDRTIEVLANPLNEVNQARARRAMAQIETNIAAAQRRAELEYERAVAEAKRTGRSQDVVGITLSDEGVAGARIDAEQHVTIDVAFNRPSYTHELSSGIEPAPARQVVIPGAVAVITVPSNVYRPEQPPNAPERFCEGETTVYLGRITAPAVTRRDSDVTVTATAAPPEAATPAVASLVIRLRGNESLIAEILRKTDWNAVLELLK